MHDVFVRRPDIRLVRHDNDRIELRTGVWNVSSINFEDDERSGHLADVVADLLLDGSSPFETASKYDVTVDEILSIHETLVERGALIPVNELSQWRSASVFQSGTVGVRAERRNKPACAYIIASRQNDADVIVDSLNSQHPDTLVRSVDEPTIDRLCSADFIDASDSFDVAELSGSFEGLSGGLIVCYWHEIDPQLFTNLSVLATELDSPLLIGAVDGPFAMIGPCYVPKKTACFHCAELRIINAIRDHNLYQEYRDALSRGDVTPPTLEAMPANSFDDVVRDLTCMEACSLLVYGASISAERLLTIYAPIMEFAYHDLHPVPRCPVCQMQPTQEAPLYSDLRAWVSTQLGWED